jgi:hypothetical protein
MDTSSIVFPLSTNIKSFQRWGDNDISKRIKQSLILYDKVILETGTYKLEGKDAVLQGYTPWNAVNTKEQVLKEIQWAQTNDEDMFITHRARILGDFFVDAHKYKVNKEDYFIADFRTLDITSELESGKYGHPDFIEYLDINRYGDHYEQVNFRTKRDMADNDFAETVKRTLGTLPAFAFLNNLNDSLLISSKTDMTVAVDSIYSNLLALKSKSQIGRQFSMLEKLTETAIFPDFAELSLEKIIQLRKDKALTSFRLKVLELSQKLKSGDFDVKDIFAHDLMKEIWEFAPSKKGVIINAFMGVFSNVPLPAVGGLSSIHDLAKEVSNYQKFSSHWLSFVLKAKEFERKS